MRLEINFFKSLSNLWTKFFFLSGQVDPQTAAIYLSPVPVPVPVPVHTENVEKTLNVQVMHNSIIQGVPINMGINENRLRFQIVDK